jgi:hypothetical protein
MSSINLKKILIFGLMAALFQANVLFSMQPRPADRRWFKKPPLEFKPKIPFTLLKPLVFSPHGQFCFYASSDNVSSLAKIYFDERHPAYLKNEALATLRSCLREADGFVKKSDELREFIESLKRIITILEETGAAASRS